MGLTKSSDLTVVAVDPLGAVATTDDQRITWAKREHRVYEKLSKFNTRGVLLRQRGEDAQKLMADGIFDLVFVDSGLDRGADVRDWLPKVRKGGILAGHDLSLHFDDIFV